MILRRSGMFILLNTILMLVLSSLGFTSSNRGLEELLPQCNLFNKKIFSCPKTLQREKLIGLLNAPCKTVPSKSEGGLPDHVAEPKEIEPGLWAAHKMTDTTRLLALLKQDTQKLITVHLDVDESRPKGTLGEEFDSIIGTYHFYQKKSLEDSQAQKLPGYSLIVTFYQKKS